MRILHYSLGLPPYRSGGMTQYATALMEQQAKEGHCVTLLYPGGIGLKHSKSYICRQHSAGKPFDVYELKNPLPVALLHGVRHPEDFMNEKRINLTDWREFLKTVGPEVIHLHTLMGLPKGFLEIAKSMGIRIVFSSHDYYGICLKVNLINEQQQLCTEICAAQCRQCNRTAPGTRFLRMRNEPWVHRFKSVANRLKGRLSQGKQTEQPPYRAGTHIHDTSLRGSDDDYKKLQDYYQAMLSMIDKIHFNSSVSEATYRHFLPIKASEIIPITHKNITDRRQRKTFSEPELKIGFIGSLAPYKGFRNLKKALLKLDSAAQWTLNVYGGTAGKDRDSNRIIYRGKYQMEELESIYQEMDVLVVPSICKETFGLVVLEALSFGVPVICSRQVGAKDLVAQYAPEFIYDTQEELEELLGRLLDSKEKLIAFNQALLRQDWEHSLSHHTQVLEEKIYLYSNNNS